MRTNPVTTPLDHSGNRSVPERPISVAELFTIGIGPSSSHTVGPMRAAFDFAQRTLGQEGRQRGRRQGATPQRVTCDLYGSLALTGRGHATDTATILGLAGWEPERLDPDTATGILAGIRERQQLLLAGRHAIGFADADIVFHPRQFLPEHPNGMTFTATLADGSVQTETYFRSEAARSCAKARRSPPPTSRSAIPSRPAPTCW